MCDLSSDELMSTELEKRTKYLLKSERRKTFKKWPFKDDSNCSMEKMAEAGFYCPEKRKSVSTEPDLVCCFFCCKELDCWDSNDDPWKEHRRHAPHCDFATLGKNQCDLTREDVCKLLKMLQKNILEKIESALRDKVSKNYEESKKLKLKRKT